MGVPGHIVFRQGKRVVITDPKQINDPPRGRESLAVGFFSFLADPEAFEPNLDSG